MDIKPINECNTVAELLAIPERWTIKAPARDLRGLAVLPRDENAVCFCLLGAICKIYSDETKIEEKTRGYLRTAICTWNEAPGRTHSEVLELVKKLGI
jgi:hypothetical protein